MRAAARAGWVAMLLGSAACAAEAGDTEPPVVHLLGVGSRVRVQLKNPQPSGPDDSLMVVAGTVTQASDERGCIRLELDADSRVSLFGQPVNDDFTLEAQPGPVPDGRWQVFSAETLNEDGISCLLGRRPRTPSD